MNPYYNRAVQPPASLKALGDPIYEAFYGLNEQPFAISTDPRFFYLSASHQRAFSELLNGLRRRESLMLLTGDSIQVIPDRAHVGFMRSYPNLIPLPAAAVLRIAAAVGPFDFEVIYGAWWGRVVPRDAKGAVRRSAQRYVGAVRG